MHSDGSTNTHGLLLIIDRPEKKSAGPSRGPPAGGASVARVGKIGR